MKHFYYPIMAFGGKNEIHNYINDMITELTFDHKISVIMILASFRLEIIRKLTNFQ